MPHGQNPPPNKNGTGDNIVLHNEIENTQQCTSSQWYIIDKYNFAKDKRPQQNIWPLNKLLSFLNLNWGHFRGIPVLGVARRWVTIIEIYV